MKTDYLKWASIVVLLATIAVFSFNVGFNAGMQKGKELDGKLTELVKEDLRDCRQLISEDYNIALGKIKEVREGCSRSVDKNCLLIITNGEKPITENAHRSLIFPIRTLDVKKQEISGNKQGVWNYWLNCKTEGYNWAE